MAEYYLISQLPSLDGITDSTPLPVTSEKFTELCRRFLGKKALSELEKISLVPPRVAEKSSSPLIERWNEGERNLRLALARLRAEKMNKPTDDSSQLIPSSYLQAARTAADANDPMEAELLLNKIRLELLEALRPMDSFSDEFIFYYAIKLKIIERIRKFDTASGEAAYRNIYDSIMNNDRQEVM